MKTQPCQTLLSFSKGNAKLGREIHTFSLPAGHTCPGALKCLASADRKSGQITDGPLQEFRCFAASAEAAYPQARESRWNNFQLIRAAGSKIEMITLIAASIPDQAKVIRVHVSGDFFSEEYFLAWMAVAGMRPDIRFYAYTKSLPIWRKCREFVPDNFILTASLGGKFDDYASGLKTAKVVYTEEQAEALGLQIDHDDSHAYEGTENFALLLHGTQPAGTPAAEALKKLRAAGKGGYPKRKLKDENHPHVRST